MTEYKVKPGDTLDSIASEMLGDASLEAALNPEDGEWMYYVLTSEEGAHTFATTEQEFLDAKQVCIDLDLGCG